MLNHSSSLFSRILLLIGGMAVIGLAYFFIETSLAPVPVPPVSPQPGAVRFDPTLDVSKNSVFFGLRPLGPDVSVPQAVGRPNPFVPPPSAPTSTIATPMAPSSTDASMTGAATATH